MCGIAGWTDWERDLTQQCDVVEKMISSLSHRGPDAQKVWVSPRAALAHRRLIVIDPENGSQPMSYKRGDYTYTITYNGEIYNFRELGKELESHGHIFCTKSDTEVLLHSYLEWGADCVKHFNGIFAFGIWDESAQQLFIARDHLGVKPLFYAQRGSAILFASELKALLVHPLVEAEIDMDGLAEIFSLAPIHTPGSGLFRDIHEVKPGHFILFNRNSTRVSQYWSLYSKPHTDDLETTVERIKEILSDTVKRQLIADVGVVTMLSGGLDSSGLTALAAREFRQEGKQLHTYSVDFEDSEKYFVTGVARVSLDAPWVKRVSEYTSTCHHTITVGTSELLDYLLVPMRAHDCPGLGELETSMYLLFKKMKEDATVALSGESADEVFGGYPWFHMEDPLSISTFPWLATITKDGARQYASSWLSPEMTEKVQPTMYIERRYNEAVEEVPRLDGEDALAAKRREMFYMNLTRFLPVLLDRKDRMSMATGFEVRVPFCDYRLVEYIWNVPWEMKNIDNIEKGILRRAFADVLPDDARNRRKSAYPVSHHPHYLKGVRNWVLQILNDPNAAIRPLINLPVLKIIAEGKIPLPDSLPTMLFERVIQINSWLKEYSIHIC